MSFLANASSIVRSRLAKAFPFAYGSSAKHDYYADFGWPECLEFDHFYKIYTRNSIAAAAVDKTIAKTWEELPSLWELPDKPADTPLEEQIEKHFRDAGIWRAMMNVDRRGMVGAYGGAIILIRDGKALDLPVDRVARIEDIAAIIPAWEGQLQVSQWDTDITSETYAQPVMFEFTEQAVDISSANAKPRTNIKIHPSRVLIWSEDGTINGRSDLEPGFNDLVDVEKIKGSGGEGFWKSSRGAPIITAPQGMSYVDVQKAMGGTSPEDTKDKLNDKLDDFQSGFDKGLMLGGMDAKVMTITLPQPKEFFEVNVQSFAASMQIPFKVLVGNITGERASTEDAREWARTCMSRRTNLCVPMIQEFVRRLVAWGALPAKDWHVGWPSLLDATPDELLDRAVKMKTINSGDEPIFLPDEIREAAGFAPSGDVEGWDEYMAEREADAVDAADAAPGNAGV